MIFGAVFSAETNDEYRTITPEMLREQMPELQLTQLFQPNIENAPPHRANHYNQHGNSAPPNAHSYSHQNENHNQAPQSTNYGYYVRHDVHRDVRHEGQRDGPRDGPRDSPRDGPRDSPRDGPRDSPRDSYSMSSMPMPMHHDYDPEQIGKCLFLVLTFSVKY